MNISEVTKTAIPEDEVERSKVSFRNLTQRIKRHESRESFVGQYELTQAGFIIDPFWLTPGDTEGECYLPYIAQHPYFELKVRQSVFKRLTAAVEILPEHWQLILKAGFRPLEVQKAVLVSFMNESRKNHPDWTEDEHLKQARTFVADPKLVCPPHTTGGAVDVDLVDRKTGKKIDMGCPPNADSEISFLHSDLLTKDQYANRMILLNAMLGAGFAPNVYEWWHYQYGETYWAAFYGHKTTLYDIVKA